MDPPAPLTAIATIPARAATNSQSLGDLHIVGDPPPTGGTRYWSAHMKTLKTSLTLAALVIAAAAQAQVGVLQGTVAGVKADTISYVETHGTGTTVGDPLEIKGLTQAFREHTERAAEGFAFGGGVHANPTVSFGVDAN